MAKHRPLQTPRHESWRRYVTRRYWTRKARALAMLGNACARCGDRGHDLQFDHLPSTTKVGKVTDLIKRRWDVAEAEIAKCQLLCPPCHEEVTDLRRDDDHDCPF